MPSLPLFSMLHFFNVYIFPPIMGVLHHHHRSKAPISQWSHHQILIATVTHLRFLDPKPPKNQMKNAFFWSESGGQRRYFFSYLWKPKKNGILKDCVCFLLLCYGCTQYVCLWVRKRKACLKPPPLQMLFHVSTVKWMVITPHSSLERKWDKNTPKYYYYNIIYIYTVSYVTYSKWNDV